MNRNQRDEVGEMLNKFLEQDSKFTLRPGNKTARENSPADPSRVFHGKIRSSKNSKLLFSISAQGTQMRRKSALNQHN
jgi:hypothetical protein